MNAQAVFTRIDRTLPLPAFKTEKSVGADLCARLDTEISPHTIAYIPLNVIIKPPEGYWVMIASRSSTHKLGILPIHGVGIGDPDFCGPEDEYSFPAYNFTDDTVKIQRGDRIAQAVFVPYSSVEICESDSDGPGEVSRGGFGSTGLQ